MYVVIIAYPTAGKSYYTADAPSAEAAVRTALADAKLEPKGRLTVNPNGATACAGCGNGILATAIRAKHLG